MGLWGSSDLRVAASQLRLSLIQARNAERTRQQKATARPVQPAYEPKEGDGTPKKRAAQASDEPSKQQPPEQKEKQKPSYPEHGASEPSNQEPAEQKEKPSHPEHGASEPSNQQPAEQKEKPSHPEHVPGGLYISLNAC